MKRARLFAILIPLILAGSNLPSFAAETAGCLVRVGEKTLFVRDVWSSKYALPSGGAQPGELLARAAERGTFDQTGVRVKAQKLLMQLPRRFSLFRCLLQEPLPVLKPNIVPHPTAVWNKIIDGTLITPSEIPAQKWRYPSQREQILGLFKSVTPQSEQATTKLAMLQPTAAERLGLSFIQKFQIQESEVARYFFVLLTLLGDGFLLMLLVPFLWFFSSRRLAAEAIFLIGTAAIVNALSKQFFQMVRPFNFEPGLKLWKAQGFGFPSGHSMTVVLVWGFLAYHLKSRTLSLLVLPFALACGFSRMYLGVHFPHDVLCGWAMGFALLLGYKKLAFRKHISFSVWALILVPLSSISLALHFHPESVFIVSLLLGFAAVLIVNQKPVAAPSNFAAKTAYTAIAVALIFAIDFVFSRSLPKEAGTMPMVAHFALKAFSLPLALGILERIELKLGPKARKPKKKKA